jgi:hypothetical protein
MQPEFKTILKLFSRIRAYSFGVQNGVHFGVRFLSVGEYADIHFPFHNWKGGAEREGQRERNWSP